MRAKSSVTTTSFQIFPTSSEMKGGLRGLDPCGFRGERLASRGARAAATSVTAIQDSTAVQSAPGGRGSALGPRPRPPPRPRRGRSLQASVERQRGRWGARVSSEGGSSPPSRSSRRGVAPCPPARSAPSPAPPPLPRSGRGPSGSALPRHGARVPAAQPELPARRLFAPRLLSCPRARAEGARPRARPRPSPPAAPQLRSGRLPKPSPPSGPGTGKLVGTLQRVPGCGRRPTLRCGLRSGAGAAA